MREIKFNAVDEDRNVIYTYDEWYEENGANDSHNEDLGEFLAEHYGCKLLQYTGLEDKNRVEIYEGDIVKSNRGTLFKVIYSIRNASFELEMIKETRFTYKISWMDTVEVIGNIYENPNLLKE